MIERRPFTTLLAHALVLMGVLVVAFPIALAWIAATQTPEQIAQRK